MKRIIPVILAVIVSGCSFFVTRSIHDMIQTFNDFTLLRVVKECEVASVDELLAGDVTLFVEFGADTCLVAEFSRGRETYTVEVVSFLTQKGVLGAFFLTDIPGSYPVDLGYHARKSDTVLQFVKGHYTVSVLLSRGGSMSGAQDLALGLAKRIRWTAIKPDLYEGLPQSSMVEQSELYFMGPKVFQERFSRDLAEVLYLENAREGLAAKYQTGDGVVDLIKIRYPKTEQTLEAVTSYLKSRSDRPILLPREGLQFYTIVEPDRSGIYIAEYADWLYMMLGSPPDGKGQEFFEYVLRGGK